MAWVWRPGQGRPPPEGTGPFLSAFLKRLGPGTLGPRSTRAGPETTGCCQEGKVGMCVGYFLCHQTGFLPTLLLPWPGVPFWGPRTSSLVREGKEPRGGGPGWGSLRGRTAGPGQRPARSPGRLGLSASGSGCGDLPRALGTRCSRLRSSSGRGVAPRRVRGAREAGGAGPGGSPRSE